MLCFFFFFFFLGGGGFRVPEGFGLRGFRVWGLGFRVWGFGFRAWGFIGLGLGFGGGFFLGDSQGYETGSGVEGFWFRI